PGRPAALCGWMERSRRRIASRKSVSATAPATIPRTMLTPAADQIVVDSPSTAEAMIATATAYATTMTGRLLSSRSGAVADGPRREFVRDALIVVVGGYRLAAGELLLLDRLGRRD